MSSTSVSRGGAWRDPADAAPRPGGAPHPGLPRSGPSGGATAGPRGTSGRARTPSRPPSSGAGRCSVRAGGPAGRVAPRRGRDGARGPRPGGSACAGSRPRWRGPSRPGGPPGTRGGTAPRPWSPPAAIAVLDHLLEAVRLPGGEHRGDLQTQAAPGYPANGVRDLVRALEPRVVVELGLLGQPPGAPVRREGVQDSVGGHGFLRPRGAEAPEQRDTSQDLDGDPALDHHVLDGVEAVALSGTRRDGQEVPPARGRGIANWTEQRLLVDTHQKA